jgi:hypothetical protein
MSFFVDKVSINHGERGGAAVQANLADGVCKILISATLCVVCLHQHFLLYLLQLQEFQGSHRELCEAKKYLFAKGLTSRKGPFIPV